MITNAKTILGKENSNVVYDIPSKCQKHGYTGETDKKWESREKEHQVKVRLQKTTLATIAPKYHGKNKKFVSHLHPDVLETRLILGIEPTMLKEYF